MGIGGLLMEAMKPLCLDKGYSQVVCVASSRASVKFHQRHGFIPCGTLHRVGVRWDTVVDIYLLQYFLKDEDRSARMNKGAGFWHTDMREPDAVGAADPTTPSSPPKATAALLPTHAPFLFAAALGAAATYTALALLGKLR